MINPNILTEQQKIEYTLNFFMSSNIAESSVIIGDIIKVSLFLFVFICLDNYSQLKKEKIVKKYFLTAIIMAAWKTLNLLLFLGAIWTFLFLIFNNFGSFGDDGTLTLTLMWEPKTALFIFLSLAFWGYAFKLLRILYHLPKEYLEEGKKFWSSEIKI